MENEKKFEDLTQEEKDIVFSNENNKNIFIKVTFGTEISGPFKKKIDEDWENRKIIITGGALKMIIKTNKEAFDKIQKDSVLGEIELNKWYYI